jgi:hypothetical protein
MMGLIMWVTMFFPTLQLVWVALIPVCGGHLQSESLGAFPELQDSIKKYLQYFAGEPVPPMGAHRMRRRTTTVVCFRPLGFCKVGCSFYSEG